MKKDYTIPLLIICLFFGAIPAIISTATDETPKYQYHECIDKSHDKCDGDCECDGLGCFEDTRFNDTIKKER